MTGCLLLNKNPGISSFDSILPVKKALGTGKVCHTGTLDSFAQGLLVVLTGWAVKLSPWFTGCDKQYRALIRFGEETDTLDPEGKVTASAPVPGREALEAALPAFTGEIMQAPPAFSAIHINGRRAHELARAGVVPEMKKRPVTVHSLSLLSWDPPHAELEVRCSSGTYIRSLARDIALSLGSRSHLRSLQRTKVGKFSLDKALSIPPAAGLASLPETSTPEETLPEAPIRAAIKPLSPELFAQLGIPGITVDEKTAGAVSHGGDLRFLDIPGIEHGTEGAKDAVFALFGPAFIERTPDQRLSFAALIECKNGSWKYGCVNPHAASGGVYAAD
ncbi:MAG: tRNA pseudouridine(55) synthase TruB [Spirochaetaceae bacterium]|jgi:tRNA pseudouridine55 synthase|nr:tRNA pseudouridine(55) synthase TruB [Spirochaetaceae bacterium]